MITKHGPHYWLDIRVNGRRIRRSLKTGERTLALGRALELTKKLRESGAGKGPMFDAFADQYLAWARTQKPASVRVEGGRLNWIKAFMARHNVVRLSDVTPLLVEQMRSELQNERIEKTRVKDGRGRATINRYCQILRGMFYKAEDWGLYPGPNPLKKVRFFRETPEVRPLSITDFKLILAAAKQISKQKYASPLQRILPDLIVFLANTGMRRSEALNLKWRDIREKTATVIGKGDKKRVVPLNWSALDILKRQPKTGDFVFDVPNRDQSNFPKRTFDQIRKKTGIHFYFHLLRHFFATSLLERGVDIVTISNLLGHSKAMTSLIYSHSDPARMRKAVESLVDTKADTRPADVIIVNPPKSLKRLN